MEKKRERESEAGGVNESITVMSYHLQNIVALPLIKRLEGT